jgi:hypothetical protein
VSIKEQTMCVFSGKILIRKKLQGMKDELRATG